MLLNERRSSTWNDLLDKTMTQALERIELEIGNNHTPEPKNVLRFMNNDLSKMKICIVGQDPYFSLDGENLVSIGRAFQPNNLVDWSQTYKQVSLKNMIRLIHKTYTGIEAYEEIKKYKEIVSEIQGGKFNIKPPKEWFDSMEEQGVLFLNRYLTTEIGVANAHRDIWDDFMAKVIQYIDQKRPDMIWFLWGTEAAGCAQLLSNGVRYLNRHPMMCSNKYDDDFLKAECFKRTMGIVNWLG
ncbi:MAG: uracil-DNA glycosylase [Vallitaleaceae bacterium]|nr:uracil-DNA glycosylase [Vallitaleaceae bacterium]